MDEIYQLMKKYGLSLQEATEVQARQSAPALRDNYPTLQRGPESPQQANGRIDAVRADRDEMIRREMIRRNAELEAKRGDYQQGISDRKEAQHRELADALRRTNQVREELAAGRAAQAAEQARRDAEIARYESLPPEGSVPRKERERSRLSLSDIASLGNVRIR